MAAETVSSGAFGRCTPRQVGLSVNVAFSGQDHRSRTARLSPAGLADATVYGADLTDADSPTPASKT